MEVLDKILGNAARVKIMRLFLLNRSRGFKGKDVAKRSRIDLSTAHREIRLLASVDFIKKKSKLSPEWYFNSLFKYGSEFKDLLVNSDSLNKKKLLNKFKKVGQIKLFIISGVFVKNEDSRVDLLIVGDQMKKGKIEEGIRKLESEIGVELVYALFTTKEFVYRLNMFDKLVRDILDYPHEVILQSRELSTQVLKKT